MMMAQLLLVGMASVVAAATTGKKGCSEMPVECAALTNLGKALGSTKWAKGKNT
jgi:hypothetical protein